MRAHSQILLYVRVSPDYLVNIQPGCLFVAATPTTPLATPQHTEAHPPDQAVDVHLPRLPDAVAAVLCLGVHGGVPVCTGKKGSQGREMEMEGGPGTCSTAGTAGGR